jgi:hypothetical protein
MYDSALDIIASSPDPCIIVHFSFWSVSRLFSDSAGTTVEAAELPALRALLVPRF